MQDIQHLLHKTKLKDRDLWYDGDSSLTSENIKKFLIGGKGTDHIFVNELTDDIEHFNQLVSESERLIVKKDVKELKFEWNIPIEYKKLDVSEYIFNKFYNEIKSKKMYNKDGTFSKKLILRIKRVSEEIKLFKKYELIDVLRTLIYIINKLESKNVVWGVGRGSSVSSYILYLIGVHDIDSVEFDLDVNEFLHTTGE